MKKTAYLIHFKYDHPYDGSVIRGWQICDTQTSKPIVLPVKALSLADKPIIVEESSWRRQGDACNAAKQNGIRLIRQKSLDWGD